MQANAPANAADSSQVPRWPVLHVEVMASGDGSVDGQRFSTASIVDARHMAIARAAERAQSFGRAVRVEWRGPEGSSKFVVTPNGVLTPWEEATETGHLTRRRAVLASVAGGVFVACIVGSIVGVSALAPREAAPPVAKPSAQAVAPVDITYAKTPTPGWSNKAAWSTVIVKESGPLMLEGGNVGVLLSPTEFAVLDGTTGAVVWRRTLPEGVEPANLRAALVDGKSAVYAYSQAGQFYVWLVATGQRYEFLAPGAFDVVGGGSSPLLRLAGNRAGVLTSSGVEVSSVASGWVASSADGADITMTSLNQWVITRNNVQGSQHSASPPQEGTWNFRGFLATGRGKTIATYVSADKLRAVVQTYDAASGDLLSTAQVLPTIVLADFSKANYIAYSTDGTVLRVGTTVIDVERGTAVDVPTVSVSSAFLGNAYGVDSKTKRRVIVQGGEAKAMEGVDPAVPWGVTKGFAVVLADTTLGREIYALKPADSGSEKS